jgi:hypothetical protein
MVCPGRVPAFPKKGWQISLEECGATLVDKTTIKFTTDQHCSISVANERYLKYFVEIILKLKFYSIAVITFYLLRPLKLTNQNQSQVQSVQLFITFAT